MTTTLERPIRLPSYQAAPSVALRPMTVERMMTLLHLATTEGSAHQLLLKTREMNGRIGQAFAMAQAFERMPWFTEPFERAMDRAPLPDFGKASMGEAESDGEEDVAWEAYTQHPTVESWRAYKRVAYRDIARLTLKIRAGDAKYGEG